MKHAIYLDARERDLVRRVFVLICEEIRHGVSGNSLTIGAIKWTHDEIQVLAENFEEPADKTDGGDNE